MYSKEIWVADLHRLFKARLGMESLDAYRAFVDDISFFDDAYDGGASAYAAFEEYLEKED